MTKRERNMKKMSYAELNSDTIYVYIQTYQLAKNYLTRALESIKKQTYSNFRCIIYDNCSGEEVRNMLQEYVKSDQRFSLTYFDKTMGHVIMWEYGIPEILHMAGDRGGFFSIVDADDELKPDCFEKMITYMKKNDLDMVASGSVFIEANTMKINSIRSIQTETILEGNLFEKKFPEYYQIMRTHWGKLYKIDVIKRMNLSNLNVVPYGGDTLFVREALLKSKRVGIIPEALYKYYLYSMPRTYNLRLGRLSAPKMLLERDLSFIMQKCGNISSNTIIWLINVYLRENVDAFGLIVNNEKDCHKQIEEIYSVLSPVPCRMAMRLGARGEFAYLCDWLLHQKILENEETFSKCCEIFGILCTIPGKISNGGNADRFKFLVKLYDFWDDWDSKQTVEKEILNCARNSLLLQDCDFYYCKYNADVVEDLLRENYIEAYKKIKEVTQKKDYFEKQFIKKNIELGQNVAAILQDEAEFVYMNKRKIELLMDDDMAKALSEVNEWLQILPEDEEFLRIKKYIIEKGDL